MSQELQNKFKVMSNEQLKKASECLKTISHPARLKMVQLLMQGELPVYSIAALCHLSPNQTCEHLRMMLGRGFLKSRKDGRTVYYSITSPKLPALIHCINAHIDTPDDK
jgi:DNA-binding transcriptional ArsR family regulator